MSTQSAARYAAAQLKKIATRQVKVVEPRPRLISPGEQRRRFVEGDEYWRFQTGEVSPDQWQRYVNAMTEG